MAEAMRGVGRVFAWDLHEHRVELIRAAARRLGLENVRPMTHDARRAPESMMLSMDAVLVDAPCSGLGVIADKPDVKYRLNDEELDGLPDIQKSILDACAKCVRPGGRLVYSTCTILPEENQNQVRAFIERHPEFEMDENVNYLPEVLRSHAESGMISILPNRPLLSVMRQYTPCYKAADYTELNRRITTFEYRKVTDFCAELGFDGFTQEKGCETLDMTPVWEE